MKRHEWFQFLICAGLGGVGLMILEGIAWYRRKHGCCENCGAKL